MNQIVVAIIGAAVAVLTLVYNKQKELRIKQRNLKEEKYISFLKALINVKAGKTSDALEVTNTLQIINLIGSNEVIEKTYEFVEIMKGNKEKISKSQDELYSEMIKSMRKDLYGKRYNKKFLKELQLIIFT